MKIAVIGAGISGLACAHELESLGIEFDIFERRKKPGEISEYSTVHLNVMSRPIIDFPKFAKETFNITITPINRLHKLKMIAPNKTANIAGDLGQIFLRGQDTNSLENQIYHSIKTQVSFDTHIEIDDLKNKYDKVVVATGNNKIAKDLGAWQDYFPSFGVKLTRIVGTFDPYELTVWLNTEYAKTGYVCMIPFDTKSASIELVVPDTNKDELESLWSKFTSTEKLKLNIVETYDLEFSVGASNPLNIGNIYFTGNAGGFVEPFLGFGQIMSIWSGVMAARSIVNGFDYNSEMQKVHQKVKDMSNYRRALNRMDNKGFDRLVRFLGLPLIRNLIYNTKIDFAKLGTRFIR